MSEAPAFHLGCGGRLRFSADIVGRACETCERCGHNGVVGRRPPTAADNNGKGRHHGQGIQKKRGIGRAWKLPPKAT